MKRPTADASLGPAAAGPYEILHLAADVAADIAGVVGDAAAAAADVVGAAAEAAVGGVAVVDQGTSFSPQFKELTLRRRKVGIRERERDQI